MFVAKQSPSDVAALLDSLGEVIYTTDVRVKSASKVLVTSSCALDFHTDHHLPKWILWHCIEQTDDGGETILVDAAKIYRNLDGAHKSALSEIMLFEHKMFGGDRGYYPLVAEKDGVLRFYYFFWTARENLPEAQKSALSAFRSALVAEPPVKIKLGKGDVIIVDNHRILHGRCEIKGTRNRFLKRFWVQCHQQKGETT
ncbi:MAG: TauD/TfdA family dioxygenase [Betaproteobacteria bacterium]|nr:TauD/TfdA family dioxygenase [Betaproteobacteria bacterium]